MARRFTVLITIGAVGIGVAGCAGFRTERQGRDVGRAICDVKDADNADEAQRALDKLNRHYEKALRITGRPVSEDVRDIQENVSDLAEHAVQGQGTLAQQDVAVIRRNIDAVADTAPGLVRRFYEGVNEGLGDCT